MQTHTNYTLHLYTVLFLRERFREGLLDAPGFAYRLTLLGYLPSEIRAEISDVLENERKEIYL